MYDFPMATTAIYNLWLYDFANNYLEMIKVSIHRFFFIFLSLTRSCSLSFWRMTLKGSKLSRTCSLSLLTMACGWSRLLLLELHLLSRISTLQAYFALHALPSGRAVAALAPVPWRE
jgi:hypothetical protein